MLKGEWLIGFRLTPEPKVSDPLAGTTELPVSGGSGDISAEKPLSPPEGTGATTNVSKEREPGEDEIEAIDDADILDDDETPEGEPF